MLCRAGRPCELRSCIREPGVSPLFFRGSHCGVTLLQTVVVLGVVLRSTPLPYLLLLMKRKFCSRVSQPFSTKCGLCLKIGARPGVHDGPFVLSKIRRAGDREGPLEAVLDGQTPGSDRRGPL